MKALYMDKHMCMLFALLRGGLHGGVPEMDPFRGASAEDWKNCYRLAARQGVMALAWDGVVRLSADLQPPRMVKLSWAAGVAAYEEKYLRYCRTVDELSRYYAGHGIAVMQLKGVGFSTLYPVPAHREGGDIDIYTYSVDKNRLSDAEANRLADTLMQQQGIEVDTSHTVKHSNFHYKGIPIENHKTFLNVESYEMAGRVEQLLKESMQPQLATLAEGEVRVPSPAFNTLFIAFHAVQHYGSGLALHHLCDWAVLISRFGLHIPEGIKDKGFRHAIEALTLLCNRYLGTSVEVSVEDTAMADEMLAEILCPKYPAEVPARSKWGILVYKTRRLLHNHRLKSRILHASLSRRLWDSFVAHLRRPETIFAT